MVVFVLLPFSLGLDYIDTYLIHSPNKGKILETWDAMIELQQDKLVRSIGVSNFSDEHLRELKKARPNNIPAGKWISFLLIYVCTFIMYEGGFG